MKPRLALANVFAAGCVWSSAGMADQPAASKYDLDNDGFLESAELKVLALHYASTTLRTYDTDPVDGRLGKNELNALYRDADAAAQSAPVLALAAQADSQLKASGGRLPIDELKLPDFGEIDAAINSAVEVLKQECDLKDRVFLRRNKIDMSIYNHELGGGPAEKLGASFAFERDYVGNVSTATIDAAGAYVLFRDVCGRPDSAEEAREGFVSGYSLAAYSDANGEIRSDEAAGKSSVEFGLDGQLEFQGGLFRWSYLTAGPYVQTDFEGEAFAYGGQATYQPLDERLHMGIARRGNPWVEWYWSPILRLDALRVEKGGETGLSDDTDYVWLGSDLDLTVNILPTKLEQRLFAKANANIYWDAISGKVTELYGAGLFYNLTEDGYTSISTEYAYGTDRKEMTHKEEVNVMLNIKY